MHAKVGEKAPQRRKENAIPIGLIKIMWLQIFENKLQVAIELRSELCY